MKFAVPAFVASWTLILVGVGYGLSRGPDLLGVEFSGGVEATISFNQRVDVDKMRETVGKLGYGDPLIQYQKDVATGKENIRVTARILDEKKADETIQAIEAALQKEHPQAGFDVIGKEMVGPTVGKEIQKGALVATFVALFGILVYVAFRYELSFAVAAIIAFLHDVLMTAGWFFLTGGQMSAAWVAAILTIIGFSINDTIVIFDRIREDLKLGVRGSFRDLINLALNQTLSRTIITSGTVLIATLSLYIFGGTVLKDFAFTFLVGIITGTYSTIYIASTIVLKWHKGERPKLGAQVTMDNPAEVRV
jgi:SecD/SecF fusion protein